MVKSIEEKVEDLAKKQLNKAKVAYYTKTASINTEIDSALAAAPSKSGGKGKNYPDIKCLVEYQGRQIPVMIEVKGKENDLEKLNEKGEVDNYDKKDTPNYANIQKYAVNGAVHYATAIVNGTKSYKEAVAIGITGWEQGKNTVTAMKVYYVSDENYNVPKEVSDYAELSFLGADLLPDFIEKIDALYLTNEEKELLTRKLEDQIEVNLKALNQEMRDVYSISDAYRVKLISGMIMAGLGIEGKVNPLEIEDLRSNEESNSHDGVQILNKIESFLKEKELPEEKRDLIITNFKQVFVQNDLYKRVNDGESRLKKVYITVKEKIVPFFTKKKYHLDFTGKLFNVLNDWVKVPDGDANDVVLTPRYVCDMMVKLCQVNKDSFVWDYTAGSGGFLVAAMKEMVADANTIETKEERERKIISIMKKQLLGVELRPDMYTLAVLNMILMGDGSTHILCDDSLNNYNGKYCQGKDKDDDFPADVFLLNPPYSADGKGFNFVEKALSRMKSGRAAVLIQENAGSGNGGKYTYNLLKNNTLLASIHMSDIFCGKSGVQTAIYVFEVGHAHSEKKKVRFIDFTEDGYTRQNRKKSSQETNLKDTDHAIARYREVIDLVLGNEPETHYYTKENGRYVEDTITTTAALAEPKKVLDRIHERYDPLKQELTAIRKEKNRAAAVKDLEERLAPIEAELVAAQKVYNDIQAKIGADWTYAQHRKIETQPTEADFRKTVADYLSWKVSTILKEEGDNANFQ